MPKLVSLLKGIALSISAQPAKAALIFALVAMIVFTATVPTTRTLAQASFSIDVNSFLSSASQMFNGIFPIFAPIIGISLGIGLASFIAKRFEGIV